MSPIRFYLRKGRGAQFIEYEGPPVTARHTHTPKLLVCYHFEENNSMRHFRALNRLCNHCNLRLLTRNVAPYHISAQVCLCVYGASMENLIMYVVQVHGCVSVRVCGTCARSRLVHFMFVTLLPSYIVPM